MIKKAVVMLSIALSFAFTGAYAQSTTAGATSENTNASQSTAANQGVQMSNVWNTPSDSDSHVHYSGITGSNQSVGLSGYAGSFSPNYCGGTAQAGVSVPYATIAAGKPVLGDPGEACVKTVASVHTMEYSATYGNAAAKAAQAGDAVLAKEYSDMSKKLAQASVNMLCDLSDDVRQAYRDAGVACPATKAEKAEAAKERAVANHEPTDPFIRSRMGLASLK